MVRVSRDGSLVSTESGPTAYALGQKGCFERNLVRFLNFLIHLSFVLTIPGLLLGLSGYCQLVNKYTYLRVLFMPARGLWTGIRPYP